MKRWLLFIVGGLAGLLASALALALALAHFLRASPGEWAHTVQWRGHAFSLSMPAALRVATHPMVMGLLKGRTWQTRFGPVNWQAGARDGEWLVRCAPCRIELPEVGGDSVVLSRVELSARRTAPQEWQGEFALGAAGQAVRGRFDAAFDKRGADVRIRLPETPLAQVYALFAEVIPEMAQARIEGRLSLDARWRLPQREFTVRPRIEGFVVSGLGTEALLHAAPATCPSAPRGFGTWLPRAVIAAEDQRFHEHAGYDVQEIAQAWSTARPGETGLRGASTLSQQVAKLIYAGDGRSHVRKLRELLYAVELDRTLGKARVMHLYLSMAPWGDGHCGAAAAARHYLDRPVDKLTPIEAAWLASMLHNPDRDATVFWRDGRVDTQRIGWVIAHLRPMALARREALAQALPDWKPSTR